jgi:hypothetical protein
VSPNRRLGIQTLTNKAKDFDFFIDLKAKEFCSKRVDMLEKNHRRHQAVERGTADNKMGKKRNQIQFEHLCGNHKAGNNTPAKMGKITPAITI